MILAAGLGTRLRPLTDSRAKCLVPVGDRPILAHILDRLRAAGVERVVVNAFHRVAEVRRFVAEDGARALLSEEAELLGTAGGLARAERMLGPGDVLVWNADILAEVDIGGCVRAHRASGAEATLVVKEAAKGEGNVGLDEYGRIVRLRDTQIGEEAQGGEFVPVHVLGAGLRARLPERGCLVGDVYLPALRDGVSLRAFAHGGWWHDIGSLRGYLDANLAWLEEGRRSAWVAHHAAVGGEVVVRQSLVGEGARVVGAGTLERCVLWPGSVAVAPLADSVVVDRRVINVDSFATCVS
jgi:mannose-1-phosphate guanylyltransferase